MPAPGTSPARPAQRRKPARRDARTDRPEPRPDDRWSPPGHLPAPRQEVQAETPSSSGRIERDPEESSQAPPSRMIRPAGKAARGPSEQAETAFRSALLIPGLESITSGFPAWPVPGKLEDFLPEFADTSPVPHPPSTSASSGWQPTDRTYRSRWHQSSSRERNPRSNNMVLPILMMFRDTGPIRSRKTRPCPELLRLLAAFA